MNISVQTSTKEKYYENSLKFRQNLVGKLSFIGTESLRKSKQRLINSFTTYCKRQIEVENFSDYYAKLFSWIKPKITPRVLNKYKEQ